MSVSTNPQYCLKCDAPFASLPNQWSRVPTCQCHSPNEPHKLTLSPGMFESWLGRGWSLFLGIILALTILGLQGCTIAKYTAPDGSKVFVADFHPVGGATDIEASSDGTTRTLKATRGQGSAEGIVNAAIGVIP